MLSKEGLASLGTIADTSMRYGIRARLQRYLSKKLDKHLFVIQTSLPDIAMLSRRESASLVISVDTGMKSILDRIILISQNSARTISVWLIQTSVHLGGLLVPLLLQVMEDSRGNRNGK